MSASTLVTIWSSNRTEPLLSQIPESIVNKLLEQLPAAGTIVTFIDGKRCRMLRKSLGDYSAIAFSDNLDQVKSKKTLEAEVAVFLAAAPAIYAALERAERRTRRLLHNLKSLTAKTSQEIFYIAQQNRLLGNPREIIPYLSSEIRDDVEGTAKALLEILKHQAAQKAEYTAFDRLSGVIQQGKFELHDVHRVLMNVFYLFFGEFVEKKVRVDVGATQVQAWFDYDSIHVCIYYVVENAVKYTRHNSDLSVSVIKNSDGLVDIRFSMESLSIKPDEKERIFEEEYSGANAKNAKLSGAGIGLYLARSMAKMNAGSLNVHPGPPLGGSQYSRNTFVLTLPARKLP
ncbi:sensor histidine kinase [Burkholderia sp. LMU1-1-1.1]|uniref:sensor histidine kinase n=1 Tax=Burkholderia sp. LMU1-1-1.1 TaxID=3135266 RepID=UPI0034173B2E